MFDGPAADAAACRAARECGNAAPEGSYRKPCARERHPPPPSVDVEASASMMKALQVSRLKGMLADRTSGNPLSR
jgi:hypothetical protein